MIVGLAGHIDHGKTALVRALTGVAGDRLKEEKARGITIDLGFAYLPVADGRVLAFIDVPGHERFVHTMLAGAMGIDLALLTVAADDGVMPQTREHLAIIELLGITCGVIAITKADLVPPDHIAALIAEIRALTAGTALASADILPVSALIGLGISALRDRLLVEPDRRAGGGAFRLAVDRVFSLTGVGTVVTGTVLSGQVSVNESVIVSPQGLQARVRSLHAQNRAADIAVAGDRCALALSGSWVEVDAIHRGDVVMTNTLHCPSARIDATLRILPSEPKPVGEWFPVRLHHAAAEVGAHIIPLDAAAVTPGASAFVQLVLDRPIAAACGDRFVVRDVSARRTIGGGMFSDLRAPARRRRTAERLAQLGALSMSGVDAQLATLLETPPFAVDVPQFARDHALTVHEALDLCPAGCVALEAGGSRIVMSAPQWVAFRTTVLAYLSDFHAAHPDLQGVGREKLRLSLTPRLPEQIFLAVMQRYAGEGSVALEGAFVRLTNHAVRLTEEDENLWRGILPLLSGEVRFRPPRVRDIAGFLDRDEADIRGLLKMLSRLGRVDEIAQDHFFLRTTTAEMVAIAAEIAAGGAAFSAAQFRDRVINGRKVAIQILEFFDRHGITVRRGDTRRVNTRRLDQFALSKVG